MNEINSHSYSIYTPLVIQLFIDIGYIIYKKIKR